MNDKLEELKEKIEHARKHAKYVLKAREVAGMLRG